MSLKLAITGGMGCGKSTAAVFFAEQGFVRVDSDAIVRDDVLQRSQVVSEIAGKFGTSVLTPVGQIDRAALANTVFADDESREWLENLVHPRVVEVWQALFESQPGVRWAVEVPLLFEAGLQKWFDQTICVASSYVLQLSRLESRGVPRETAERRIAKQLPLAQKIAASDIVLLNDGSPEFLREQVVWVARRKT